VITHRGNTQFAAQLPQLKNRFWRPMFGNYKDNLGSYQDDSEQAAHVFDGLDTHIFDIQTLLLIEAIAMLKASSQAPIGVDLLDDGEVDQGDVRDQDQLPVPGFVIGDKNPQGLLSAWDAYLESAKMYRIKPGFSGMVE